MCWISSPSLPCVLEFTGLDVADVLGAVSGQDMDSELFGPQWLVVDGGVAVLDLSALGFVELTDDCPETSLPRFEGCMPVDRSPHPTFWMPSQVVMPDGTEVIFETDLSAIG